MDSNDQNYVYGRVWVWHPTGVRIELPLPAAPIEAFAYVSECLAAGFLVSAPNNEGLDKLEVSYVIRGQVTNDGVTKDRMYLYADWGKPEYGSQMVLYMNTPEDAAAFEAASHIRISDLKVVRGKAGPIRDSEGFEQNAKPVRFSLLRKKVDVTEENPKGTWKLERYENGAPIATPPQQPDEPKQSARYVDIGREEPQRQQLTDENIFNSVFAHYQKSSNGGYVVFRSKQDINLTATMHGGREKLIQLMGKQWADANGVPNWTNGNHELSLPVAVRWIQDGEYRKVEELKAI